LIRWVGRTNQLHRRITQFLSRGWELYGHPMLTYDAEQKRVICGQAIVKEVEGKEHSPDLELSEL
jgi:hypothetical protein